MQPARRSSTIRSKRRRIKPATWLLGGTLAMMIGVTLWSINYEPVQRERSEEDEAAARNWKFNDFGNLDANFTNAGIRSAAPLVKSSAVGDEVVEAHPVYPYSVVSGGVRDPEALRKAASADAVVARHYAGFDFHRARLVTVEQPRLVYVSYRVGEQVYWTTKKISLHPGEQLITDGTITSRTRCGNQISQTAKRPVAASLEPSPKILDEPFKAEAEALTTPFAGQFVSSLQPSTASGGAQPGTAITSGNSSPSGNGGNAGGLPPASVPIFTSPCNPKAERCPAPPNSTPVTPPVIPPPPVAPPPAQMPEADSLAMILIASSTSALAALRKRGRK